MQAGSRYLEWAMYRFMMCTDCERSWRVRHCDAWPPDVLSKTLSSRMNMQQRQTHLVFSPIRACEQHFP